MNPQFWKNIPGLNIRIFLHVSGMHRRLSDQSEYTPQLLMERLPDETPCWWEYPCLGCEGTQRGWIWYPVDTDRITGHFWHWSNAVCNQEKRILLTYDKDFGELALKDPRYPSPGIILVRVSQKNPELMAEYIRQVLTSRDDWQGHFSVIDAERIRMRPLPHQ